MDESVLNGKLSKEEIEAALEMVRDSEARYHTVAEAASDAIITIDQESTILFLNPAAERIFGYARDEMLGRQLTMLMPEYLRHLHRAGIERYVATHQKHISWEAVELPGLHKTGKEIPLELSFGEFTRNNRHFFTGIVRDVSERKRTERRLSTQYTVTRALAEAATLPDAMPKILEAVCETLNWDTGAFWRVDTELEVLRCAETWHRPGRAVEEFLEHSVQQTFAPGTGLPGRVWERREPAWITDVVLDDNFPRAAFARKVGLHGAFAFPILRGDEFFGVIEFFSAEIQEPDGTLLEMMATIGSQIGQFIDRVRSEMELTASEESLHFIAEASEMLASSLDYETTLSNVAHLSVPRLADWCVIHMVEENGKVQQLAAAHVDPTKLKLLGEINSRFPWGLEMAHGYRLVARTGTPELISEITDAQLKEVSRSPEHFEMLRALGLRSTLCVPLTARGRTLGAITFATAESERNYTSADLALAENLAHRASIAVDNARLYQEAQRANRIKEEFLATLSHELRTPLTPIIGWIHMIRGGGLHGDELERGLAVVERNSQALARLINDLLDMSAILSGKMRIDKAAVSLDGAIKEAVDTIRPSAERKGINLDVSLSQPSQIMVNGDRTRLVQVFWNILENAVKFSRENGTVRLSCHADEREATVTIEDEGHGIESAFLPFVFERFRQADSSKTRLHGGLGIGLALVKSFVEAHGGRVTAQSAGEEAGSRFTVHLPISTPASSVTKERDVEGEIQGPGETISVLIVEDAADTLEMLSKVLRVRGYNVRLCESAADALRAASNSSFDLILSDIGMPEIDGYELMRLMRLLPHMSDVPAIALSGYAAQRDIDAALAAGFDAHLAKPVDAATLIGAIERILQRKSSQGDRSSPSN